MSHGSSTIFDPNPVISPYFWISCESLLADGPPMDLVGPSTNMTFRVAAKVISREEAARSPRPNPFSFIFGFDVGLTVDR